MIVRKVSFIIFEIMTIMSFILLQYFAFSQEVYDRLFETKSKKTVKYNILSFVIICEYLIVKLVTLINGTQIIDTIISIGRTI
jgi:hypothetical protein